MKKQKTTKSPETSGDQRKSNPTPLSDLLEPGQTVLACGASRLALRLASAVLPGRVHLLFSQSGAMEAFRRLAEGMELVNVHLHLATSEHLPFQDAAFDVAVCQGWQEEGWDGQALADELKRVVKKGGHLVMSNEAWEVARV